MNTIETNQSDALVAAKPTQETIKLTLKDKALAPFAIVIGITMTYALWTKSMVSPGFQITCLALLLVGVAHWYSGKKIWEWGRENLFRTGAMVLIAIGFSLYQQSSLQLFLKVCLFFLTGYWFLSIMENRMDNQRESTLLSDMIRSGVANPFRYFTTFFKSLSLGLRTSADKKKILEALGGLALVLPVSAIIVQLLAASDRRFQTLVTQIFRGFVPDGNVLARVIFGLIFALYFYGLFFGGKLNIEEDKRLKFLEKQKDSRFMTRVSLLVIIGLLSFIYVVYTALQVDTLISVLQGRSPWVLTIYAYARQGFYELCQVVLINAGVLTFVTRYLKEEERGKALRLMQSLLCILTLALIAVALSKMGLYIGQYGLTPKRFMTSWLMVTMAIAFVFVLISYYKTIALGKWLLRIGLMMLVVLSLINVDGTVVRYNIQAYTRGDIAEFDTDFLYTQADAAIRPAMKAYEETKDPVLKRKLAVFLNGQKTEQTSVYKSDRPNYNRESILAKKAILQWHEQ